MPAPMTRRGLLSQPLDSLVAALQPPDGTPDPRVFPKLFPNPTGLNGWEDFVLAGDALLGVAAYDQAEQSGATLAGKRAALGQAPVRKALGLIRSGLAKSLVSPRGDWSAANFSTTFPDLATFRRLSRLLALEQQVLYADGRPGGAIEAFRIGLRLAEVPKSEALIGGLVGSACAAIALARCVRHVESLPQRECDHLASILRAHLALEDRSALCLTHERQALENVLREFEHSPDSLADLMGDEPGEGTPPEVVQEQRRLRADLSAVNDNAVKRAELAREIRQVIDQHFQRLQARLTNPWDERPAPPRDDTLAGRLGGLVLPTARTVDRFVELRAQMVLLLGHALVRRYFWEMDRLPASLDDLRAGEWLNDPFSRRPILYKKVGDTRYELESVGPAAVDAQGNPVPGQRRAVRLPAARAGA